MNSVLFGHARAESALLVIEDSSEVGDPQGNGLTFDDFPTVVIPVNGVNYHLQDLVMLPWFADEVPSSAENGWYDFPATTQIHAPALYCN
jgi:hypothetical protein